MDAKERPCPQALTRHLIGRIPECREVQGRTRMAMMAIHDFHRRISATSIGTLVVFSRILYRDDIQ